MFPFRLSFPNGCGVVCAKGSPELNLICQFGSVNSISSPPPAKYILPVLQLHLIHQRPESDQFSHFFSLCHAPEAPQTVVVLQISCHKVIFSPSQLE
jgi:hypothetical protein